MPELDSEALSFLAASELFAPVHKRKRADLEFIARDVRKRKNVRGVVKLPELFVVLYPRLTNQN